MIPQEKYLEVVLRVLKTDEGPEQDSVEELYDDYCTGAWRRAQPSTAWYLN